MPRYILDTPKDLTAQNIRNIVSHATPAGHTGPAITLEPMRRRLEIHGRRWFQRSYGNTYHTVRVVLDGETVFKSGTVYGYGSQYVQTAKDWLISVGHLTQEDARKFLLRELFDYTETVQDVPRERDL